jgi:glycerophosphoryl diester phosphodiesterase
VTPLARANAERVWRRAPGAPPLVLGHRGARRRAPENTLAAFELAIEAGARGVELDVRLDGSGNVVVLHDRTLERVSAGGDRRDVETLSSDELSRVLLDGGARVPTLEAVLDWAKSGGHLLNVEVKRDVSERTKLVKALVRLLWRTSGARSFVLLSSFDPLLVRTLAAALPEIPAAWLVHAKQWLVKRAPAWQRLGAVGVHPERTLASDAEVARLRAAGALVNVWTVNDGEEARRLAAAGVDGLVSDVPGEVLAALARS